MTPPQPRLSLALLLGLRRPGIDNTASPAAVLAGVVVGLILGGLAGFSHSRTEGAHRRDLAETGVRVEATVLTPQRETRARSGKTRGVNRDARVTLSDGRVVTVDLRGVRLDPPVRRGDGTLSRRLERGDKLTVVLPGPKSKHREPLAARQVDESSRWFLTKTYLAFLGAGGFLGLIIAWALSRRRRRARARRGHG